MPDHRAIEELQLELKDHRLVRELHWKTEVTSTSDWAKEWLASGGCRNSDAETFFPAVFVADKQKSGRGRSGSQWWSPSGCLMFTAILPTKVLPDATEKWSQLSLLIGLSIAETVDQFVPKSADLKWPNDVYVAGRKLAGVLIESNSVSREMHADWMIGIGLNVMIDWEDAPLELQSKGTCLRTCGASKLDVSAILYDLLHCMRGRILQWQEAPDSWQSAWRDRCMLIGRQLHIKLGQEIVAGHCCSINDLGQLILETGQGLRSIAAGEILEWT